MNRIERNISQEDLSFGICSPSNLSRIENNEQIPSRTKYENFMERMGLSTLIFPSFRSEREVKLYQLKHNINQLFIENKYTEAEKLLQAMKKLSSSEEVDKIFIEYVDVLLMKRKNETPHKILETLIKLTQKSIRDINPEKISNQVLSKLDLNMLNNLSLIYYDTGYNDLGIDLLYSLVEYIERKIVDYKGISPLYTGVLHNLTNWVGLKGDHIEVIKLCDIGIKRCIEYNAYSSFAELKFNKGYALIMLGDKKGARKYIQEAFFINRARGEMNICEIIKKFAFEQNINLGD